MRSIAFLAALLSLAIPLTASAQVSLEEYNRAHAESAPADSAFSNSTTRTFGASEVPPRINTSWDHARNPAVPFGLRSDQEWHCRLHDERRQLQKCGAHTRWGGQLYNPSVWYVYTFDGARTSDAPIPVEHVSSPASARTQVASAPSGGLQHEATQEMIVQHTPDGGVYAASYQAKPTWGDVAKAGALEAGPSVVSAIASRLLFGKNAGYGYPNTGYNRVGTSFYGSSRCSMPPGYTGPIIPCS